MRAKNSVLRFAPKAAVALLVVAGAHRVAIASTIQISSGFGGWNCGFYPGFTGYGGGNFFSFAADDAQGNPITGFLNIGNAHAAPACNPGIQSFQGTTVPHLAAAIDGEYTYLGQNYYTTGAGIPLSACANPDC